MTFSTDFSKSLKAISQDFKATANQMITNNCAFSVQSHTISYTKDDETIFHDFNNMHFVGSINRIILWHPFIYG